MILVKIHYYIVYLTVIYSLNVYFIVIHLLVLIVCLIVIYLLVLIVSLIVIYILIDGIIYSDLFTNSLFHT